MTPILVLIMGIKPTLAVGTDLFYAAITKMAGGTIHGFQRTVSFKVAGLLFAGSLPGSLIAGYLLGELKRTYGDQLDMMIAKGVGLMLILVSISLLAPNLFRKEAAREKPDEENWSFQKLAILPVTGLIVGFLVTLTSIGSGTLICACLFLFFPALGAAKIVGTDIVHAAGLVSVAAMAHFFVGDVDFNLAGNLLIGSLPGIALGSRLVVVIPEYVLRYSMSGVMLMAGIKLV